LADHGLKAVLHGKDVILGHLSFLRNHNVALPAAFKPGSSKQTTTFVAVNGQLAGTISFNDELRPESRRTLKLLKKLGIRHLLMITGDNAGTANRIAQQLGIEDVKAEASSGNKLHAIEAVANRPVVFVGDGVNEAPVLTAADVGIALGANGSIIASESADILILQNDLSLVAQALSIAKRTFKIAHQSILGGIFLSLVLMLLFATGRFSSLLGAILQGAVDVLVVFNTLRAAK
jgi:P-type E1-E2 ATPase